MPLVRRALLSELGSTSEGTPDGNCSISVRAPVPCGINTEQSKSQESNANGDAGDWHSINLSLECWSDLLDTFISENRLVSIKHTLYIDSVDNDTIDKDICWPKRAFARKPILYTTG